MDFWFISDMYFTLIPNAPNYYMINKVSHTSDSEIFFLYNLKSRQLWSQMEGNSFLVQQPNFSAITGESP